jgi:hypothetical protein
MEETRNTNSEEKKPVGRPWRTWEVKVKWIFRKYDARVQILCSWTLSTLLSLSKNTLLFIFQNTFRRLDSVSETSWFENKG